MTRFVSIAAAAILCSAAVAAGQLVPLSSDVGCKTKEDTAKYNECVKGCKKRSDKAQKSCNDGYRDCRSKCAGADKKACRERCRTAYRECSQKQRAKLKTCRADCISANHCEEIPGAAGP